MILWNIFIIMIIMIFFLFLLGNKDNGKLRNLVLGYIVNKWESWVILF